MARPGDTGALIEEDSVMNHDSGMLKVIADERARTLRAEAKAARRARTARRARGK